MISSASVTIIISSRNHMQSAQHLDTRSRGVGSKKPGRQKQKAEKPEVGRKKQDAEEQESEAQAE